MKQNIINVLCLVSLLGIANAGIVKNERICYDHDGKEIPCKLMVSNKEDFGFKVAPKKRGLFSNGLFGGLFGGHNHNNDNSFDDHTSDNTYDDFSTETNWNTDNSSSQDLTQTQINDDDLGSSWNTGNNANGGFTNTQTNDDDDDNTGFSTNWNTGNIGNGDFTNTQTNDDVDDGNFDTNWNTGNDDFTNGNFDDNWDFGSTWPGTIPGNVPGSSAGSTGSTDIDVGLNDEGVDRSSSGRSSSSTYTGSVKLPINDLTMTDFHGCTSDQASTLKYLIDDITTYRAAADYVLNHLEEDSMFEQIFLKYFHDHDHLSYIQKTFGSVNTMSTAEAYCEPASNNVCGDRAIAYTYGDSREFHVCPDFFSYPMYGSINDRQSEAAAIVLHELTHCYGTDDHAYGEANSQALDSARASNNADTYRLFAMKSIYYLNERGSGKSFKKMMLSKDEKIDFRDSPFKDRVLPPKNKPSSFKPVDSRTPRIIYKRDFEDFLNENIDFREIPVKDKVYDRSERQ